VAAEPDQGRVRPQRSAATLRALRSPANRLSLAVAFAANVGVAAAKLGAGLVTGSAALLAEAAHSGADSTNEVLLALSLRSSSRPADREHPLGYGGARFLWAFLATIASFLVGGCLSIALAIHDLVQGSVVTSALVAWIVLAVAAIGDGLSLVQTTRQARRQASDWGMSTIDYLRTTSDPTLRALAVEDSAALVGVAIAAAGLLVTELGGSAKSDAIASLLIGVLLGATAIGLARPLADLLIGRSMRPERLAYARQLVTDSPYVEEVLNIYGLYIAPQEVLLAAHVHPADGLDADQLAVGLDELDVLLRRKLPEIGEIVIDVTAYHAERLP
jgi:cation diffusion facilitator family transporter